jgi:NADPH-dependent glutamate synthase beta subunit-like oxidoreductase/CO/xanthine dehydrogenase FAD-binding subunit
VKSFEFAAPDTLEAAATLLAEHGPAATALAGGTDALGLMKDRVNPDYPKLVVGLRAIPGLDYVREEADGSLAIGAMTRLSTLETHPLVRDRYRLLAEAAHAVASPQLRNMGTVGGNLCQEPRCWYYRNPDNYFFCTRKGGRYCHALTGENRYHSIFGSCKVDTRPCTQGCPGSVEIPEYLEQLRSGDATAAASTLLERNPLPAVTGRVCPHTCEADCNRGLFDEAVAVRAIERYVGDFVLEHAADLLGPPAADSGRRVAIVGSGPAGLAAAYYLRTAGHAATVFERLPEPGGMLRYAIPSYRLPPDVVRREVDALEAMGVVFRCGVEVGSDVTLARLRVDHDAVLVVCGAWGQPHLGLQDEELLGSGLEFLTAVKEGLREKPGERVVVIGGGNVAVDVALAAKRLGATDVSMVCLECEDEIPALSWEIEQARAEGVTVYPSWGPARVLTEDGRLIGLELVHCTRVFDDACAFNPTFDQTVRESLAADQVFLAIGQNAYLDVLDPDGVLCGPRGYIPADASTQATSLPGVFAAGDVVSGPTTVITAIAAGRRAAAAIDAYLRPSVEVEATVAKQRVPALQAVDAAFLVPTCRAKVPESPLEARDIETEDTFGLPFAHVEQEALRCFNCGCAAVTPSDLAPALVALDAVIKTTRRILAAADFLSTPAQGSTVLEPGELVKEIWIPAPHAGSFQTYQKFRIRNSIDFPIVSVASVLRLESGRIAEARLVLGAVAPVPVRAYAAEEYLRDKESSEIVAGRAAELAVMEAHPLQKNRYKVLVAKALVKRALLTGLQEGGLSF